VLIRAEFNLSNHYIYNTLLWLYDNHHPQHYHNDTIISVMKVTITRGIKSPSLHHTASECSHFWTYLSFWPYLAPITTGRPVGPETSSAPLLVFLSPYLKCKKFAKNFHTAHLWSVGFVLLIFVYLSFARVGHVVWKCLSRKILSTYCRQKVNYRPTFYEWTCGTSCGLVILAH